ncbi:hypothetical protein PV326_006449 [Microctonus aethiopoides]|nr:hypothetical protein PV326_006449 [Microctonus aethiopoides]
MRRYSDVDTAIIEINVHTDRNAKEGENIIMRTDVIVDSHNIVVEPDFEKTINSSADNVVKKFENFHISTDHRVEKEFNDDSTLSSNATDVKSIRNLIQDKSNSEETLKTRCQNILENHERKSESIKNIIKIKKKRIDLRSCDGAWLKKNSG